MENPEILYTALEEGVFIITLNRPKVNALNTHLICTLQEALKQAENNPQTRCILITGSGEVFSAGQDLTEFQPEEVVPIRSHILRTYNPLILQIRKLEKPVLAAINGTVSGAAIGIILACDLRIASDQARFVIGFTGIGLAADSAVSLFLPAVVGLGRATELIYLNTPLDAEQALALGLVNRLAPANEFNRQAVDWAKVIASGPVHAMGLVKRELNTAILNDLEKVLDYEAHIQEIAGRSTEHKEGIRAFLEKRLPRFYP